MLIQNAYAVKQWYEFKADMDTYAQQISFVCKRLQGFV